MKSLFFIPLSSIGMKDNVYDNLTYVIWDQNNQNFLLLNLFVQRIPVFMLDISMLSMAKNE